MQKYACEQCGNGPEKPMSRPPQGWQATDDDGYICNDCKPQTETRVVSMRVLHKRNRLGRVRPDGTPYGIDLPFGPMEVVESQCEAAHDLRRRLIKAELAGREVYRHERIRLFPKLVTLEAKVARAEERVEAIIAEIRAANVKAGAKRATKAERDAKAAAVKEVRELQAELKAMRRKVDADRRMNAVSVRANAVRDEIRDRAAAMANESHLGPSTKLTVFNAVKQMVKRKKDDQGSTDPDWEHRRDWGLLVKQLQHSQTNLRRYGVPTLSTLMAGKWPGVRVRRAGKYHVFSICFTAFEKTFVDCPVFIDPGLRERWPADAAVTWISLKRQQTGGRSQWFLNLTIRRGLDVGGFASGDCARSGVVAVNPGWAVVPGGVRVASWVDERGAAGELVIPAIREKVCEHSKRLRHCVECRRLRGRHRHRTGSVEDYMRIREIDHKRDKRFNEEKDSLSAYIALGGKGVPPWLREVRSVLHKIRSKGRLIALWQRWRDDGRHAGDDEAFNALGAWVVRERHLRDFRDGLELSFERYRKHLYCSLWARLRRQYRTVVMADVDYAELRESLPAESNEHDDAMKRHMNLAAPGLFVSLCSAAEVKWVSGVNATVTCHACGHQNKDQAVEGRTFVCAGCMATVERDCNHCRNLLARYARGEVVVKKPRTARKSKGGGGKDDAAA